MKKVVSIFLILLINNILAQTQIDSLNIVAFACFGNKYEIIKENFDWKTAAKIASERGGILAEINSQIEQDSIFYFLNNAEIDITKTISTDGGGASYVWIGATDLNLEGKWMWDGNYDGIGKQFWEGTKTGTSVNGLYNNWGNEPDDFGNQDATGLALTNWPYGIAGQWNDLQTINALYSVIEYDNSTFKTENFDFFYHINLLKFDVDFKYTYDSIKVIIDEKVNETFFNLAEGQKIIESYYIPSETKTCLAYLKAFKDTVISYSNPVEFEVFNFENPLDYYSTDFENVNANDFMSSNFTIGLSGGFRNKAIHSPHNYNDNYDYTITLTKPIIVGSSNSQILYSDVAIVQPSDSIFQDYVVVEGLKNNEQWKPLNSKYNANLNPEWKAAWTSTTLYRNLYKRQLIELKEVFSPGDTIFIRFRLHSDDSTNGWGWVIDGLQIQEFPLGIIKDFNSIDKFSLEQNYPNPFNPSTTINFGLPVDSHVKLELFNILGEKVATLIDKEMKRGNHNYQLSTVNYQLPSGIYFYKLQSSSFTQSRKMLLIK